MKVFAVVNEQGHVQEVFSTEALAEWYRDLAGFETEVEAHEVDSKVVPPPVFGETVSSRERSS